MFSSLKLNCEKAWILPMKTLHVQFHETKI